MTSTGPNSGDTSKPSNPEDTAWSSVGDEVPFRGHDFDQEQGLRDVVEEEFEGFIDEPRKVIEPTPESTDEQAPKLEVNPSNPETKAPEKIPNSFQVAPGVTAESQFESITGEKVTSVTATGRVIGDKFYAELADTVGEDDYPIETWVIRERTELEPKPTSPEDKEVPNSFQVAPGATAESQFESITGEKVTSVTETGRIIGSKYYADTAGVDDGDDYPIETWIIHEMDTQGSQRPTGDSAGNPNPNVNTPDDTGNDGQSNERGDGASPDKDDDSSDTSGEGVDDNEDQEDQPKNPELDFDEQIDRYDKAHIERLEKEAEQAKLEAEKANLKAKKLELELEIAKLQLESERQAPSGKRRRIGVLNWLFGSKKNRTERQAASAARGENHDDDSSNSPDDAADDILSRVDEILKDGADDSGNPNTSQDNSEGGKHEEPHTKNEYFNREREFWNSIGDFGMKLITDEEIPSEDNADRVKEWWENTSDVVRERISKDAAYQRLANKLREQKIIS